MKRLLAFAATCLLSCAIAFAQGRVTDQAPASGTQQTGNTVNSNPNSNGTSPSPAQGSTSRTPSSSNQALPGNANPANAATQDGRANGQAVRSDQSSSATAGTAAGGDNSAARRDDTGSNPGAGNPTNTTRLTRTGVPWLWVALGVIVGIVLVGALFSRGRVVSDVDDVNRGTQVRREREVIDTRDDDIRRAG